MSVPNSCPDCALGRHDLCTIELAPCSCAEIDHEPPLPSRAAVAELNIEEEGK